MANEIDGPDKDKGKKSNAGKEHNPRDMVRDNVAPRSSVGMRGPGMGGPGMGGPGAPRQTVQPQTPEQKKIAQDRAEAQLRQRERDADKAQIADMRDKGKGDRKTFHQKDFERAAQPQEKPPQQKFPPQKTPPSRDGRSR